MSSDYRINDAQSYEKYYKSSFDANLQNKFTYGFIESKIDEIKNSENVANPGCFALASQLAILPFEGLLIIFQLLLLRVQVEEVRLLHQKTIIQLDQKMSFPIMLINTDI